MEKSKVKEIALKCFQADPSINQITVVSDGNSFTDKSRAAQHAREIGGVYETITRAEAEAIDEPVNPEAPTDPTSEAAAQEAARVAAEKELLERNIEEMKYPELASLVAHLGIECEDKKMPTLVAALEAKKAELTKPE